MTTEELLNISDFKLFAAHADITHIKGFLIPANQEQQELIEKWANKWCIDGNWTGVELSLQACDAYRVEC